ncbi:MAG: Na+/H+ antiporter NhaA [candidate division Zixibacteria bacterium]|nr:Na+/H+ antiporter NhaA [candidate division Zixibacteria bacterium]
MIEIPKMQNRPVVRLIEPIIRFMHIQAMGGVVLFCCTMVALWAANSQFASWYESFWNQTLGITIGNFSMSYPIWYWVNDALMVIFFFVIGLEIKRELTTGELSEKRKIILPVAAALGGAITPALIYIFIIQDQPGQEGWAIPMATDIAFVVGALSILGKRVPHSLKIFLLSVAIVDDLLAVSVIALFYTESIQISWLLISLCGFCSIIILNKLGVRAISVYVAMGCGIWFAVYNAGIHPTIAGVALGIMTPTRSFVDRNTVSTAFMSLGSMLNSKNNMPEINEKISMSRIAQFTAKESVAPLDRLEKQLHPWVAFAIMPIFALANAGVSFQDINSGETISMAIIIGLVIGKPVGIVISTLIVTGFRWVKLPRGLSWPIMIGAGFLSGIGFTMSLFIATLGLDGELLELSKGGVLLGSAISIILGCGILLASLKSKTQNTSRLNLSNDLDH